MLQPDFVHGLGRTPHTEQLRGSRPRRSISSICPIARSKQPSDRPSGVAQAVDGSAGVFRPTGTLVSRPGGRVACACRTDNCRPRTERHECDSAGI